MFVLGPWIKVTFVGISIKSGYSIWYPTDSATFVTTYASSFKPKLGGKASYNFTNTEYISPVVSNSILTPMLYSLSPKVI